MRESRGVILDVTPVDALIEQDLLARMGHPVLVCHGPDWGHACPIVAGDCPLVDAAHGIIFQLDLDRPQHRVILKRYQEVVKDDVPLVAVVKPGQEITYKKILSGVQVWTGKPSVAELDGFAAQTETADELRTS
ncbi:MAG: hypothetical protein M3132_14790 [Actinomycetia bacterium]|nr:hypothetical protein [Actinomycetes bacterium]